MRNLFKVNDWVVSLTDDNGNYEVLIDNPVRSLRCYWDRVWDRFLFTGPKFIVPKTIVNYLHSERFSHDCNVNSVEEDVDGMQLSSRTYGVEIECCHSPELSISEKVASALRDVGVECYVEDYNHTVKTFWKIVTDSSIRGGIGMEVVSPILSGETGLSEISKVVKMLSDNDCRVNMSTGLHVHHGARDLSNDYIKRLFRFYGRNEVILDELVSASRRGNNNTYCHSIRRETEIPSSRYVKLNYQSFIKYGTIEVRHHQGSVNGEKICNWIRLTQRIIERGGNIEEEYSNLEDLIKGMGLSCLMSWFLERAEELSA